MSPKAIFAARPGTFKFSDRVVDLEVREIDSGEDVTTRLSPKQANIFLDKLSRFYTGTLQNWESFQE